MSNTIPKEYQNLPFDYSYGFFVIYKEQNKPDTFLILRQKNGHWSFPKGHGEGSETPIESARRELQEETGITGITVLDLPTIKDTYVYEKEGKKYQKVNEFFFGLVNNMNVVPQESEISEYRFMTQEEANATFTFPQQIELLQEAINALIKN